MKACVNKKCPNVRIIAPQPGHKDGSSIPPIFKNKGQSVRTGLSCMKISLRTALVPPMAISMHNLTAVYHQTKDPFSVTSARQGGQQNTLAHQLLRMRGNLGFVYKYSDSPIRGFHSRDHTSCHVTLAAIMEHYRCKQSIHFRWR